MMKKKTKIIVTIIIILIVVIGFYLYIESTHVVVNGFQQTPFITCRKNETSRTLTVIEIDLGRSDYYVDELNWEDFSIADEYGNATLPTGKVKVGDVITNCKAIINLTYIPTNSMMGDWIFPEAEDQTIDRDRDGLSDNEEQNIGTNTLDNDSDNDGINDYDEYYFWNSLSEKYSNESFSPNGDIDNDGNPNILDVDSDSDGLLDGDELEYWNNRYDYEQIESLKPDGDIDNDGIPNILDEDSDNDKVIDRVEILQGTDPADPDTDGDGIPDDTDDTPTCPLKYSYKWLAVIKNVMCGV